ncbi:uncharacterized mitochondrial protein-like protein [Tanacetum coccineum]
MDVKNAFLNGDLNEEVYMKPPLGVPHQSAEVCKLRKALYGLKQAPHAWYEKLSTFITSLVFVPSHHDSALFVKRSSVGRILLSLYVDDMIITGDDCDRIKLLKAKSSHCFAKKDLGLLCHFLGIEAASSPKELRAYCDVDWAGDSITHKSTTGFCIFLGDSYLMEE